MCSCALTDYMKTVLHTLLQLDFFFVALLLFGIHSPALTFNISSLLLIAALILGFSLNVLKNYVANQSLLTCTFEYFLPRLWWSNKLLICKVSSLLILLTYTILLIYQTHITITIIFVFYITLNFSLLIFVSFQHC